MTVGDNQSGVGRERRRVEIVSDGEAEMIAEARVVIPLRIDAKIFPAGLHLDDPQDAGRRERQKVDPSAIRQSELFKRGETEIAQKPPRAARHHARRRHSFATELFPGHSVPTHCEFVSMARRQARDKRDTLLLSVNPACPAKARE